MKILHTSLKYFFLLISLISLNSVPLHAQISSGGSPYTWQNSFQPNITTHKLEKIVTPKQANNSNVNKYGSFTFAELREVYLSCENSGSWTELPNGDRLWLIEILSEGAYSLNFTFDKFLIPPDAELFVYSPNKKHILGAFTSNNNKESGILAVAAIPGDAIVIEYYEPQDAEFNGELVVGTLGHDYLNIFGHKDGQFGASDYCNIDINCNEGNDWQNHKRAVCRMISNNTGLCTGTLINNTEQDQTPYILTAGHCFINGKTPENTVYYFNYESPNCNGPDGLTNQTLSGSEYVAIKNNDDDGYLDFSLVKLSTKVPVSYKPYFAGWDSRLIEPDQSICIHHPYGDVKKISVENDTAIQDSYGNYGYDENTFWRINRWDAGMTQGGSSGSALLNKEGRIVGVLSGGDARDCSDEPENDYYQMFSVSFNKYSNESMQLKHWLDPNNTGTEVLDGLDTYNSNINVSNLNTLSHWVSNQDFVAFKADGGYLSGNNGFKDIAKAEYFDFAEFDNRTLITKAKVAFYHATGNDNNFIELQVLSEKNGLPDELIGSSLVNLAYIKSVVDRDYAEFSFFPPVEITGSIFLSVVLPDVTGDTVVILTTEETLTNTAWELNRQNEWVPYSSQNSWNKSLSHIIQLEIGNHTRIKQNAQNKLLIYPNPANHKLTIANIKNIKAPFKLSVYNANGNMVYKQTVNNTFNELEIELKQFMSGLYFIQLNNNTLNLRGTFIKN